MMKLFILTVLLSSFFLFCNQQTEKAPQPAKQSKLQNTLSQAEIDQSWQLLFDGKSAENWRGVGMDHFPETGWTIENGALVVNKISGKKEASGPSIITKKLYSNFDFKFEFKLTPNANSGVKYFVKEYSEGNRTWAIGCEYQIVDDNLAALANDPTNDRKLAALYALFEPHDKPLRPIGAWNEGRIYVRGKHVEHWLNGAKVLEYERGSEAFEKTRLASKFKKYPEFGILKEGHLLLQFHPGEVRFRNLKIKEY